MSLATVMAADARNVFCNLAEFGEALTYTPKGGAPKAIRAVVMRHEIGPDGQARDYLTDKVELHIPRDASVGVTSINTKGDAVAVADPIGAAPTTYYVRRVMGEDVGMFHVEAVK